MKDEILTVEKVIKKCFDKELTLSLEEVKIIFLIWPKITDLTIAWDEWKGRTKHALHIKSLNVFFDIKEEEE